MLRHRAGASGTIKRRIKSGTATDFDAARRLAKKDRQWRRQMDREEARIIAELSDCLGPTAVYQRGKTDSLPADKGAYLLLLRLDRPVAMCLRQRAIQLDAGWYAYAGNAYSPGGVGARRHTASSVSELPPSKT